MIATYRFTYPPVAPDWNGFEPEQTFDVPVNVPPELLGQLRNWGGRGTDRKWLSLDRILSGDLRGLADDVIDGKDYINLGQFERPDRFGPGTVNPACINESGRRILNLCTLLGYCEPDGELRIPSTRLTQGYRVVEPSADAAPDDERTDR